MSTMDNKKEAINQVNLSALTYLLNEITAYSINRVVDKSSRTDTTTVVPPSGSVQFLHKCTDLESPKILSYIGTIGFNVGCKSSQLLLTTNTSLPVLSAGNTLEAMKFICRDVWKNMYGKQIDNLRTNHVDTFVLVDNHPATASSCMVFDNYLKDKDLTPPYLEFNTGLITGVLSSLGISASVTVKASSASIGEMDVAHDITSVVYTVEVR